jgi:hypothetical protein
MIDSLRKEWLYSEKRPRDLLFTAIERLIRERPPMMVSQLGREAALLARQLSAEIGIEFENWDAAARAVMKTLMMAGASPAPRSFRFTLFTLPAALSPVTPVWIASPSVSPRCAVRPSLHAIGGHNCVEEERQ